MKIEIVIIGIILLIYGMYRVYLKPYYMIRKSFQTLKKFLDARDSLVLKLIPDLKNKKMSKEIIRCIEERKLNFSSSQNNAVLSDIKLNAKLKQFYEMFNKESKNELQKEIFVGILKAEQNLKQLRKEYNVEVAKFNQHLVKHKIVCLKLLKMRPLDQYGSVSEK